MASRKMSQVELDQITELAKAWGKIVIRRSFGEQGPGLDVDLAQMEEIAVAAAAGLTAGVLEIGTQQQALQIGDQQPCPGCNRSCGVVGFEERIIHVRGGTFVHREPKCRCPTCRRDFFPSASAAEARRPRL